MTTPHIKYQMRTVDVNRGLANNWKRTFTLDYMRVPPGWEHALELNGKMVRFAFVKLIGCTKVADDSYMAVILCGTREQALGGGWSETTYILPVMSGLRPIREEGDSTPLAEDFIRENAVCSWTKEQLETWRREKKVRIN